MTYYTEHEIVKSDPSSGGDVTVKHTSDSPTSDYNYIYEHYSNETYIGLTENSRQELPQDVLRSRFSLIRQIMECKLFWIFGIVTGACADTFTEDYAAPGSLSTLFIIMLLLYWNSYRAIYWTLLVIICLSPISYFFDTYGASLFIIIVSTFVNWESCRWFLMISSSFTLCYLIYNLIIYFYVSRKWSLDNPYKACSEIVYRYASIEKFHESITDYIINKMATFKEIHGEQMPEEFIQYVHNVYKASRERDQMQILKMPRNPGEQPELEIVDPHTYIKRQLDYAGMPCGIRKHIDKLLKREIYINNNCKTAGKVLKYQIGDVRPRTQRTRLPAETKLQYFTFTCDEAQSWFNGNALRRVTYESKVTHQVLLCKDLMEELDIYLARNNGEVTVKNLNNYVAKRENYLITPEEQTDQLLHATRRQLIQSKIRAARVQEQIDAVDEDIEDFSNTIAAAKWKRVLRNTDKRLVRLIRTSPMLNLVLNLATLLKIIIIVTMGLVVWWLWKTSLATSVSIDQPSDETTVLKSVGEIYGHNTDYIPKVSGKPDKEGFEKIRQGYTTKDETWTFKINDSNVYNDSLQWFDLHNIENQDAAVEQRVAGTNVTERYNPDTKRMRRIAHQIADELRPRVRKLDDIYNLDNLVEYIRTRPAYTAAQKENIISSLDKYAGESMQQVLAHCRYHAFIKDEAYPKNNRPRAIMACDDLLKVIAGAVFGEIGEALFSTEHCIKLVSISDRPYYITERLEGKGEYIYQTDHTAFECAATTDMQRNTEYLVYKDLYPELEWLFDYMMTDQTIATGFGDDCSIFRIPCSRWSGAPNTSLGNTLLNMIFIRMIGEKYNATLDYLVEGDDGLIVSDIELDMDKVSLYAEEQGFDLKIESKEDLSHAGFLSMTWDPRDMIPTMTSRWRYIESCLSFRLDKVKRIGFWPLLTARLLSLVTREPKCPLFKAAYRGALSLSQGSIKTERSWYQYHYFTHILGFNVTVDSNDTLKVDDPNIPLPTFEDISIDENDYYYTHEEYLKLCNDFQSNSEAKFFNALVRMQEIYYDRDFDYRSNYVFDYETWKEVLPWITHFKTTLLKTILRKMGFRM